MPSLSPRVGPRVGANPDSANFAFQQVWAKRPAAGPTPGKKSNFFHAAPGPAFRGKAPSPCVLCKIAEGCCGIKQRRAGVGETCPAAGCGARAGPDRVPGASGEGLVAPGPS